MRKIDIEFMDLYKETDNLCKEVFSYDKGITDYINEMKDNEKKGSDTLSYWKDEYKKLKRLRWIRNKIAHESADSECEQQDIQELKKFRNRLRNKTDVLSQFRKHESKKKETRIRKLVLSVLIGLILISVVLYLCHLNGLL